MRADGRAVEVELFGAVGVKQAGKGALLFAVAGKEGVAVVVVFCDGVGGVAAFEFAQPAAIDEVVDVVVAGGEVVEGEVGVVAEAAHELVFAAAELGWCKDWQPRRQQAARARVVVKFLPEVVDARFPLGMDGSEAVVPEAALLSVERAVMLGEFLRQVL